MKFCIGVFDNHLPNNEEFTGNGFSNSHTILRGVNQFLNQFSYLLTCLVPVLHNDLHNVPFSYDEFRGMKHTESHILLRDVKEICQHILHFSCDLDELHHERCRKDTGSFVTVGALKVTLSLGVNEFLIVLFRFTVLQEMCIQCRSGPVSSWNSAPARQYTNTPTSVS
jgi:hypothetical protein